MIIVLNNKCNLTKYEFLEYQENLKDIKSNTTIVLCPNHLNIANFTLTNCYLGAQNVSEYSNGAYTGEISAAQLKSYDVKYCLVGHSERRTNQQETITNICEKIKKLYAEGIKPIFCLGETKEQREAGKAKEVIEKELKYMIDTLNEDEINNLIIAYEPVWSIGTGIIPTLEELIEVFELIKKQLPNTKVLYGGSVNEKNINELKQAAIINGYLLGGLSLKLESLKKLLNNLEN